MATTISRSSLTDGVSVWNAALVNSAIYDKIDAILAAATTYGGVLGSEALGTHSFTASGTGANVLRIRNSSAGTGNSAAISIGNDSSAGNAGYLTMHSSTYTTSGTSIANGLLVGCGQAGGITIEAGHASGRIRIVGAGETVAPADSGSKRATLLISDSGGSTGNGGSIEMGAGFGGTQSHFASIKAWLENGSNNTTGSLRIYNRAAATDSSLTEVMRISNRVEITDGSETAPGLAFIADGNTGIYRYGTDAVSITCGGDEALRMDGNVAGAVRELILTGIASSNIGPTFTIERNSGGAPATLSLYDKNGTRYYLWVDTTGDVRIHTSPPTVIGGDTGGSVVGSQS